MGSSRFDDSHFVLSPSVPFVKVAERVVEGDVVAEEVDLVAEEVDVVAEEVDVAAEEVDVVAEEVDAVAEAE